MTRSARTFTKRSGAISSDLKASRPCVRAGPWPLCDHVLLPSPFILSIPASRRHFLSPHRLMSHVSYISRHHYPHVSCFSIFHYLLSRSALIISGLTIIIRVSGPLVLSIVCTPVHALLSDFVYIISVSLSFYSPGFCVIVRRCLRHVVLSVLSSSRVIS